MKTLTGYAAVWDAMSLPIGGFVEVIRRGAFTHSLRESDARFLWSHDVSHPLGRVSAGNLRLSEDATGLRFELDLPDTGAAQDLLDLVTRKIVTGMSFGFVVPPGGDSWLRAGRNGYPIRELRGIDLHEISGCAWPCYPSTSLVVRSASAPMPALDVRRRRLRLLELVA